MLLDKLRFSCSAIGQDGRFRIENTGRGADTSPEFRIENLSRDAVTLAVVLEDTSHPLFHDFTHWLLWNVPAQQTIPACLPSGRSLPDLGGARQGLGYGVFRYAGPKPPRGKTHEYRFTVYALDCAVDVPFPATKKRFLRAASGRILQRGTLTGMFS